MNQNPSNWEKDNYADIKVSSLNCRSLIKHHKDISTDDILLKSDIIGLQETWLSSDERREDLHIPGFDLFINSQGKGKGIATYCKKGMFNHVGDIKQNFMQLSKFTSPLIDIIFVYRSQQGNMDEMNQHLGKMKSGDKPQLILGDFNFCYLDKSSNPTNCFFKQENFSQLILRPTHIEGNLLDQAYLQDIHDTLEVTVETHSKYYSDHKGLAIMIKEAKITN